MDELEQLLLDKINELLDNFYDYNDLETNYQNRKSNNNKKDNEIQILEKEKKNLEKKINENKVYYRKLYEDNVKGLITEDIFKMLSEDYLNEIDTMTKRINIIDEDIQRLVNLKESKKKAEDILSKYKHIDILNKVIIDEFVDKIYIGNFDKETKTRDINIVWDLEF